MGFMRRERRAGGLPHSTTEAGEEVFQGVGFGGGQRIHEARNQSELARKDSLDETAALGRDPEEIHAAVGFGSLAFDKAAGAETVDQADHIALGHEEMIGEFLLADRSLFTQGHEGIELG